MISRRRLILSYTIQQVIPNICTKFQNPRFSSSWEIFDTKKVYTHTHTHTHTHIHTHTHTHTQTHTHTNIVTEKTKNSYTRGIIRDVGYYYLSSKASSIHLYLPSSPLTRSRMIMGGTGRPCLASNFWNSSCKQFFPCSNRLACNIHVQHVTIKLAFALLLSG